MVKASRPGKRMQTGNTKTMIFSVAKLVSYVSEFMTLQPGDVITIGMPPGVGLGMKQRRKLRSCSLPLWGREQGRRLPYCTSSLGEHDLPGVASRPTIISIRQLCHSLEDRYLHTM